MTNNFELPALAIADLYKPCWQVELFLKWIKQHLRVKVFFSTSQNAVRTQIWIANSIYSALDTHVVQLVRRASNVSQAVAISELREGHAGKLVPTGEAPQPVIAIVASNASTKDLIGKESDQLREPGAANIHAPSWHPYRLRSGFSNRGITKTGPTTCGAVRCRRCSEP